MGRKKQISDQRRLYAERMRLQKGVFSSLANAAGHIGELYADFVQSDEVRNSMKATADKARAYVNPTSTDAYKSTAEKYNTESQKLEHINGRLYSS